MKVGREHLAEDVERVAAVREVVGPQIPLMVDANMRWTVDQAIQAARAFTEYGVYWLEEPTIPDDVAGHVRILREGGLPIAAGENLRTIYEFQKMIAAEAVSFPEPDVTNIGGIMPWLKVAHLAEAFNLPVTSHGVHDVHVHLLAAVPNASYLEAHGFGLDRFIQHPLEIVDGYAAAPDRPGHGVAFNWQVLEPHRVP
jgi:L-alanine-DL-glutamate epimerase-like enolase superfamily enzyme